MVDLIYDYKVHDSAYGLDIYRSDGTYVCDMHGKHLTDYFADVDEPTDNEKIFLVHVIDDYLSEQGE